MVEVDGNQGSVQVLLAVRALTLERMKSYIQETATLKLQRELVIKKGYRMAIFVYHRTVRIYV